MDSFFLPKGKHNIQFKFHHIYHGSLQIELLYFFPHNNVLFGNAITYLTYPFGAFGLFNSFAITSSALNIPVVQLLSRVGLFPTPWTAARQASLSITNSWSLLKLMSIELVMPSNHLILCRPLLLLPSIFPIIRVFSNESALCIRCPKYWSFSFSFSPSKNIQD